MQWMICAMLHFARYVFLDIWRIKRYVCFWPLWFSKPTISSTVITFSSICVCFSLPVSCRWSVLRVSHISVKTFPPFFCCSLSSKILPVFSDNCIFKRVQFFNQSLVSIVKWHITSPIYRHCIKNYYLRQYRLLLFTNIRNVFQTKHNLIFVRKLVKIVSEDNFLHRSMYYSDFSDF